MSEPISITFNKGTDIEHTVFFKEGMVIHKEDGPAIIYKFGLKQWKINGKFHREDGPAIEFTDGERCFYLNVIQYLEEEYWAKIRFGSFI